MWAAPLRLAAPALCLVNALEWEELKIVFFIEPRAFEHLEREAGSPRERQRIDGGLHVRVLFFPRFRFVIKDVEKAVPDLEKINVSGDHLGVDGEIEPAASIVGDIVARQVNGNLDSDRHRVVDEHEALQRFMALPICRADGQRKRGQAGCVVLLPSDRRMQLDRELGRSLAACLEELVREVIIYAREVPL